MKRIILTAAAVLSLLACAGAARACHYGSCGAAYFAAPSYFSFAPVLTYSLAVPAPVAVEAQAYAAPAVAPAFSYAAPAFSYAAPAAVVRQRFFAAPAVVQQKVVVRQVRQQVVVRQKGAAAAVRVDVGGRRGLFQRLGGGDRVRVRVRTR